MEKGEEGQREVRREEDFNDFIKDLIGYETLFGKGGKGRGVEKIEKERGEKRGRFQGPN